MQRNSSEVKEFILLAFMDLHDFQPLLFILVLTMYITCITGDLTIILLVIKTSSLRTPMYFFIGHFAVLEICFVSIIVPKFLDILITSNNKISFAGCFVQMYSFDAMGIVECYLLTVMTYDRHLAITSPLHYVNILGQIKVKLAAFPWVAGLFLAVITTTFTAHVDFCGPNTLDHYFCDMAPLQSLSCSDPFISNLTTSAAAVLVIVLPYIVIILFYSHIIITVSKIKSTEGKRKAFSTCTSHLIVTSLFFGTCSIVYIRPSGNQYDKYFSLIYTIITPTLNPFIYTLRNKDVKRAFFKFFKLNSAQSATFITKSPKMIFS